MKRKKRQERILRWAASVFGTQKALSMPIRGNRLLEEALEVAQAAGVIRRWLTS